jgi:hypothetical protein
VRRGKKADMIRGEYWQVTKKDWFQTAFRLFVFITILGISSVLLLLGYWYFWLLIVVAVPVLFVEWHTKNFAYRCPRCGKVFEISALGALLGPNGVKNKYLKCPLCRRRAWAEILKIKEQSFLRNKPSFEEQNNTDYEKGKG